MRTTGCTTTQQQYILFDRQHAYAPTFYIFLTYKSGTPQGANRRSLKPLSLQARYKRS